MDIMAMAMGLKEDSQWNEMTSSFYIYFQQNLDEIERSDGLNHHVGTAFYFIAQREEKKSSSKYKLSIVAGFLNLINALKINNMQACLDAHRLFLLLENNKEYFDVELMGCAFSISDLFQMDSGNVMESIKQLRGCIYNFLSQYFFGDGAAALSMLHQDEQKRFRDDFQKVIQDIDRNPETRIVIIKNGIRVLNALHQKLHERIDIWRFMGIV